MNCATESNFNTSDGKLFQTGVTRLTKSFHTIYLATLCNAFSASLSLAFLYLWFQKLACIERPTLTHILQLYSVI